jgi:hypothetical protein
MRLRPELAQQNPCHSASDDRPNGGRACPRRQVAQHLRHDNHSECDYGGEQNETRDNRCRCPISNIAHCTPPHPKPFHIAGANVNGWLTEVDPTSRALLGTRFAQDRFRVGELVRSPVAAGTGADAAPPPAGGGNPRPARPIRAITDPVVDLDRAAGSDRAPPVWAASPAVVALEPYARTKLARRHARLGGSPHSGRYFWDDRLTASVNLISNSISISNKSRTGNASEQLYRPRIPRLRRTTQPSYPSISIRTHGRGHKTDARSGAADGLACVARVLGCDLAGGIVTGCGVVTVSQSSWERGA